VRITLRNAATQDVLSVSTATMVHVEISADCARAKNPNDCNKRVPATISERDIRPMIALVPAMSQPNPQWLHRGGRSLILAALARLRRFMQATSPAL